MPHFRTLRFLIWIHGLTLFSAVGGVPMGQFWVIRAGNETADPLVEAVEGKKLPPDELASRITALIDGKKIQQLARFDQVLGEEVFRRKNVTGEMHFPGDDEKMDMGVTVEAEVTLAQDSRKADVRFVTEMYEKKSKDEYFQKTVNSAHTIYGDRWELMGLWKNAKESTLSLARVTDYPAAAVAEPDSPATVLQVELLEIQPEDLAQFRKSTPATRQKAAVWLRGRSKILAATVAKLRSGQRSGYDDAVGCFSGDRGGFTLRCEQTTSDDGKKVDVTLSAQWQDSEKPAAKEDYQFTVGETLDAGLPQLFEPATTRSSKGPSPVLVITPQVSLPKDHSQKIVAPPDPGTLPEGLSTQTYSVAPSFMRVMQGTQDVNKRIPLREALAQRGLEFTAGSSATFSNQRCEVLFTHTRDGHMKFAALLKELDLLP